MPTTDQPRGAWPLPRGLVILIGAASAVLVIGGLRAASEIIGPTFLALVLAIGVHPLRGVLERRHWPTWARTLVSIVAVYAVVLGLVVALLLAVARLATLLPEYKDDLNGLVSSGVEQLRAGGVGQAQLDSVEGSFDSGQLIAAFENLLGGLLGVVSSLFFLLTLLLFLTVDAASFPEKLRAQRGPRTAVVDALESFARGTRRYLVVSTVFGAAVALLDTLFLSLTPIPAPLLWGLLAFITNYIPNVGFVIGLIPPAILGLLEGGPGLMLLVIAVYSLLNIVIQTFIQPKVVGDAVGLSVTITFLSLVFWAWVFGAAGALLAIPLTLLVKALLVDVDRDSVWMKPLMAGGPPSRTSTAKDHP